MNLLQFSSQKPTFKNNTTTFTIKNKFFYRDDKNLNNQHIIVKDFLKRSLEFEFKLLHFEKNRYSYCKTY